MFFINTSINIVSRILHFPVSCIAPLWLRWRERLNADDVPTAPLSLCGHSSTHPHHCHFLFFCVLLQYADNMVHSVRLLSRDCTRAIWWIDYTKYGCFQGSVMTNVHMLTIRHNSLGLSAISDLTRLRECSKLDGLGIEENISLVVGTRRNGHNNQSIPFFSPAFSI